jgi:hypothetical protein
MATGNVGYKWDDLRFPAQSIVAGSAPPSAENDTGFWLFSGSATNRVAGIAQMPHTWKEGTTIVPHVHWQKTTSASGNVLWQLDYEVVANGAVAAMDYGTQLQQTATVTGTPDNDTANECLISSFGEIDMTGEEISVLIFWKLSRIGGDASDTYDAANARLLEFDIHYQKDAAGSVTQFTKHWEDRP